MKVCIAEAMKRVKELEEEKARLLQAESRRGVIEYKENENKVEVDYDYDATRRAIKTLDDEVRRIRWIVSKANCALPIDGFDMSICEGLILLAQLRKEHMQLSHMAMRNQLSRRITANGVLEYSECLYDVKQVEEPVRSTRRA